MKNLADLYQTLPTGSPACEGCSILEKSKPCHSVMDYENIEEADVLFLSDSLKFRQGRPIPFDSAEMKIIKECFPYEAQFSASVKCPSVKEADMSPANMEICRHHLEATITKVKPKLVFVCGNLAMKMLVKKSGITDKRGKIYTYSTSDGHTTHVCPISHPYSVMKEPRHKYLFERDIQNAYDKYILEKKGEGKVTYEVLMTLEAVEKTANVLATTSQTVACDIETTGLNFLTDKIMTIALSTEEGTSVIPLEHKDSPFLTDEVVLQSVWDHLRKIMSNPHNKKIFHNAKFDLKFLLNYGITVVNVWDTKIMHHFIDENIPKGLKDLVKLYFPCELEEF